MLKTVTIQCKKRYITYYLIVIYKICMLLASHIFIVVRLTFGEGYKCSKVVTFTIVTGIGCVFPKNLSKRSMNEEQASYM